MLTGGMQGSYSFGLPTLDQLKNSKNVSVYQGPGWSTDAFIVSSFKGVLGDVQVRQALSLALNRQGIIDSVYKGAALMPKWLSNPGTFGYGKSVFDAAYASAPVMSQNIAEAKKLVQEAGATGKTITIGTSSQLANISAVTGAYQAAAQAIGLKVALKSVSAQNYINFFTDASARQGIDGFLTVNYGDYADPAALLVHARPARRVAELRQLQRPQAHLPARAGARHGQPGPAGRAHGAGREDQQPAAALDPRRPADQPAAAEQEPDRRGRVVRVHVRAVGQQPGRDRLSRCAGGSSPAGWPCCWPAC